MTLTTVADPLTLLNEIAEVAGDQARGKWVASRLSALGYTPQSDEVGNVWAGDGRLLLVAHLDTVLEPGPVRRQGERWHGAAVGDNSSGIAVLVSQAEALLSKGLTLAFSVGEEGLGNLRGARELVRRLGPKMLVAVDGYMPSVISQAVGSIRWRVHFKGQGGHAWGDRDNPTPVPALGQAMAQMYAMDRPANTSLNVGRVWGGGAINAIPKEVGLELDIRASEAAVLHDMAQRTRQILMEVAQKSRVVLELEVLGERPAGSTATPEMLSAAKAALFEAGHEARFVPGSTDASAGVEAAVPAMALGVYVGGKAHTSEEWVETESLHRGARALKSLVQRLIS